MLKTILRISFTVSFALVAITADAQRGPQSVGVPVLTFVLDGTGALRPLTGIAGSASVGAPLNLGFSLAQTAIPPNPDYVLAMTGEGLPVFLQINGETATAHSMDAFVGGGGNTGQAGCSSEDSDVPWGARPTSCQTGSSNQASTIDRITLSPNGTAAAFFSQSDQRVYVVASLPASPTLVGRFEVAALGPLSALAVTDDGRTVALGVSDGARGSVFLLTANQRPHVIATLPHPSAVTFLHNSSDAVIADDVQNTVYKLSGGHVFPIATGADGISGPTSIAISNDNEKTFVANSASGSVTTIQPHGAVAEPIPCNCTLTGLHPTNTDSVFRLTDFTGGPVLLFDGTSAAPRLMFARVESGL